MFRKNFFRPTVLKVILSLILFVVFVPVLEYPFMCNIPPCGSGLATMFRYFYGGFTIHGINFVMLILGVILSYIISCAISSGVRKILHK